MWDRQTITHHLTANDQCGQKSSTEVMAFAWTGLDIDLIEDLREELHTVIVINGEELVVLFLGNLMRNSLSIDDCGHLVFAIRCRVNLNIPHLDLTAMCSLTVKALALIKLQKGCTVHPVGSGILDVHFLLVDDALPVVRKV